MIPQNQTNFLIEVTKELYNKINRLLPSDDMDTVILHYSPYWKEYKQIDEF